MPTKHWSQGGVLPIHMEPAELRTVLASSVRQAMDFPWESFSFGDAIWTLASVSVLIEEVRESDSEGWDDLLEDLEALKANGQSTIAFSG